VCESVTLAPVCVVPVLMMKRRSQRPPPNLQGLRADVQVKYHEACSSAGRIPSVETCPTNGRLRFDSGHGNREPRSLEQQVRPSLVHVRADETRRGRRSSLERPNGAVRLGAAGESILGGPWTRRLYPCGYKLSQRTYRWGQAAVEGIPSPTLRCPTARPFETPVPLDSNATV
jgi:hypothetical protein